MDASIVIAALAALPGVLTSFRAIVEVRKVHVLVNSQKDALTLLLKDALQTISVLERTAIEVQQIVKAQALELETLHKRIAPLDMGE